MSDMAATRGCSVSGAIHAINHLLTAVAPLYVQVSRAEKEDQFRRALLIQRPPWLFVKLIGHECHPSSIWKKKFRSPSIVGADTLMSL